MNRPRRGGRRPEPRIVDVRTHPRSAVSLIVAAEWLEMSTRALLARIQDGRLRGRQDGRVIRIDLADLREYDERRRAS